MSAPKLVEPNGCGRCGIPLPHGQQTGSGGLHGWERPSDAQVLARMKARRLARVVAREGALPVPAGPEPMPLSVEQERAIRSLDLLALMDDRAAPVISGHLAALLGEIDRLRAERHSTNESLSEAAEALRADRCRIAELERVIADSPASYVLMDRARAAQALRGRDLLDAVTVDRAEQAHWRRLGLEDPHDSPLHHPYTTPHDLPESGDVE